MADKVYICSSCGKKSEAETKFCSDCGSSMACYRADEIKFVCEKCGKEFEEKWNFCHDCAGRIVTAVPYTYTCSQCGRVLNENVKFCSECGGKVVRGGGIIEPGRTSAPAAPAAPSFQPAAPSFQPAAPSFQPAAPSFQPAAPAAMTGDKPEFCPGCGQTTLLRGFCTNCGYKKGT